MSETAASAATAAYRIIDPTTSKEVGIVYATSLADAKRQLVGPAETNLFAAYTTLQIVPPTTEQPQMPSQKTPPSTATSPEMLSLALLGAIDWLLKGLSLLTDAVVISSYLLMMWMLGWPLWASLSLVLIGTKVALALTGRHFTRKLLRQHREAMESTIEQLQSILSDAAEKQQPSSDDAPSAKPPVH